MKRRSIFLLAGAGLFLCVLAVGLIFTKKLSITQYFAADYEVQGIDVSHYQGEIDWKKIEEQRVAFAFVKATEGSSHVDGCFAENWSEIADTEILTGAYHFFSFDSAGRTQAEHFIQTVGDLTGKLLPVVDVEYYGEKWTNPPEVEEVRRELSDMLDVLEAHYGVKPMLYTTYEVYHRYLKGKFDAYPLWIRNVYYPPLFSMKERWVFWQYSDTAVMEGYDGEEPCIDKNVFYGSEDELKAYLIP